MPDPLVTELAEAGLVLQAALPVDRLDRSVVASMDAADLEPATFRSLVMFAQAGTLLFDRHVAERLDRPDPFDETSIELVEDWMNEHHAGGRWRLVYPGRALLPLGRLAEFVGWGRASPLGLTIHSEYGLWTAHRVVVLTDLDFDPPRPADPHPCTTCATTDCVTACPVDAVSITTGFDVVACSTHRIEPGSGCAYECLARNACPVGAEHRYGPAQMHHHYGAGLESIRRWLQADRSDPPAEG